MSKRKKAPTAEQQVQWKAEEALTKQADQVMENLRLSCAQHLGATIRKRIRNALEMGANIADVTFDMERDAMVGQSRAAEVKFQQMLSAPRLTPETQKTTAKPAFKRPRQIPISRKKQASKVDPWLVARTASQQNGAPKRLTFGAVLVSKGVTVASERSADVGGSMKPSKSKAPEVKATNPITYDVPLLHTVTVGNAAISGVPKVMKRIPASLKREFAVYVHQNRNSGKSADNLANEFLKKAGVANTTQQPAKPAANDPAVVSAVITEIAAVELVVTDMVDVPVPVTLSPEGIPTSLLRDGHELKGVSAERLVRQRDAVVQAEFRAMVRQNFGNRCAVSGKILGGVLEAAHIEGAALGCYSVGNGILLSPTLHKLFDRNLMGVNPETLTVHFKPGIELEEYEGRVIAPLVYNLDKLRLAARWDEYLKGST